MIKIRTKAGILNIILLAGFMLSCGNTREQTEKPLNPPPVDSTSYEMVEQDLIEEQRAEVYVIEKKAVVFFLLNKKEMKELMHEIGDSYRWETEALFNNFSNQVSTFQSLLKKHNINCTLSNSKQFEIKLQEGKVVSFDRIEHDQILGEIITDGIQEPLIEFGMYTNKELAGLLQDFFKIENLGYVPPDSLEIAPDQDTIP